MHHPLMSNGSHGGQFSIEKQIFPLEQKILTSYWLIYKPTKKNDRASPQDIQKTIHCLCKTHQNSLQSQDNVIVVSGHDHNLQFIDKDNIKQIISGAGSKSTAARAINPNDFPMEKWICYFRPI
jgi:predicted oxidoreductase (fatty acid repression mutant protein)